MATVTPTAVAPSLRSALAGLAAVMAVSFALHAVPQALRDWIDPAWSMLLLMIADAVLLAAVARKRGALRAAAAIALLLALTIVLREQAIAALPSIAVNLLLATFFGATLRAGSTPLLVRIAERSHPHDLSPAFAAYLRRLTAVWAVFFVAMAAASLLLALFAELAVWSLFVNVLTWPLTAALFVGEYAFRRVFRRRLPARTPGKIVGATLSYFWSNDVVGRAGSR